MKKDVLKYYADLYENYKELVENLECWGEQLEKNAISPETYKKKCERVEIVKNNYFRIAYIIHLYNKPGKFKKFINKIAKKWYSITSKKIEWDGPENATLDAIKKENRDVLDNMDL